MNRRTPKLPDLALLGALVVAWLAVTTSGAGLPGSPAQWAPGAGEEQVAAARPTTVGEEFRRAPDLWAFVLGHAQSARDGATLYFLSQALEECYGVSHAFDEGGPEGGLFDATNAAGDAPARLAAAELLALPCRGFAGRPIDSGEVFALIAASAAMQDPRAIARMLLFRDIAAPKDELAPVLRELLATHDPGVVRDVGAFLSRGETEWVFGSSAVDARVAAIAWELAACDLGYDCGAGSRLASSQCALNGACRAAGYEQALSTVEEPDRLQGAQQLRGGIVRAIGNGDWQWLGLGERAGSQ